MKRSTGFCTVRAPEKTEYRPLTALPAAGLLSAGAAWLLGVPLWAAAGCIVLCAGLLAAERWRFLPAVVLALTALFCAVFYRQVGAGLLQYCNALLERLTALTGRIHLPFAVGETPQTGWLAAPLCLLPALAACRSVRRGGLAFCAASWLVFAPSCALGFFAPEGLLLLAAGTAALLLYRERAVRWPALALVLACAVALSPLALLTVPESGLPQALHRTLHELRYDGTDRAMPEGDLRDLPARSRSDTPALALTMETPQKLYLRGFLGERYTDSGWAALENSTLTDAADRFYLLHENGFYAQSSIGSAAKSVDITSTSTLTVTNLAACAGKQYLPYALVGSGTLDAAVIADNRTTGTRETMTLQYLPGSVPEWYALQSALAAAQDRAAVKAYLAQEQQYRDFVNERYLQLTSAAADAAARMLEGHITGRTLPELRGATLDALEEHLTYDETAATACGDEEFLTHLLATGGRGYDVHYATAAVLLLRYCGVPARYVEGYYLPAAEAAQSVTLTERHAHAWAEYYLDGVGWVPFEVTPGYMDNEESTLTAVSEKEYENTQLPPPVQQQPQTQHRPQRTVRPIWLLVLVPLLLAAAIVRTVLCRRRLKKRLAALEAAEARQAVAGWYGYAVWLQQKTGLRLENAEAEALNREALFSDHPMNAVQAAQMRAYAETVRAECRKRNVWQRLCDRWLRCLY